MAAKQKGNNSCAGCLLMVILLAAGIYFVGGWIDSGMQAIDARLEESARQREAAREQLEDEKPLGTEARLRHEVEAVLADSNRDVPRLRVLSVDPPSGVVTITFAANDNLTMGLVRHGILMDMAEMLEAVQASGYDFAHVYVNATFVFTDAYGNSRPKAAIRADFSRETVDRINWDGFLVEDLATIADEFVVVHPELEE